jgi:hypothetical protein
MTNGLIRTIAILAVLFLAGSAMSAQKQPLPGSAETANTLGGQLIAQVEEFRQQARTQPEEAFVGFAGKKGQKLFGPLGRILCPNTDPSSGWAYFFETSIYSLSFINSDTALAVFYHPWSDVALVTEWTREKIGGSITDAELLMGDTLRNKGNPPYDIEPHWLRSPVPPYMAAAMSSAQTVRDFQSIFSSESKPFKGKWRSAITNPKLINPNHLGVGFMFERNLAGLIKFQSDPNLASVREQADAILKQLQLGRADEVLKMAGQTRPESRAAIEQYATLLGSARTITFIVKHDDQKKDNLFIFYSVPGQPEYLMSFWLRADAPATPPTIWRIDLVDQNKTVVNFDNINNALKIFK